MPLSYNLRLAAPLFLCTIAAKSTSNQQSSAASTHLFATAALFLCGFAPLLFFGLQRLGHGLVDLALHLGLLHLAHSVGVGFGARCLGLLDTPLQLRQTLLRLGRFGRRNGLSGPAGSDTSAGALLLDNRRLGLCKTRQRERTPRMVDGPAIFLC